MPQAAWRKKFSSQRSVTAHSHPRRSECCHREHRWQDAARAISTLCALIALATVSRAEDIWIRDLAAHQPPNALSRAGEDGKWIPVDYEIDSGSGVMLFTRPKSAAPELRIPLNVKGWYEIRLGVYYGASADRKLRVKLSGDRAYSYIAREVYRSEKDGHYPERDSSHFDVVETFWKAADLSGQELVISPSSRGELANFESNLAYVRLTPMDDQAVEKWLAELPTEDTKRVIATYDGGNFSIAGTTTRDDYAAEFQPLRDSDVKIANVCMARESATYYPSKVGTLVPPAPHSGLGNCFRDSIANGIDPLKECIEAAHEAGVLLFPHDRLVGPQLPPNHIRSQFGGQFQVDHPEWLATYPDGQPTRHMSFAFPGVRDFYVRLLREWVEDYGADGVSLLFSRSYPFVYYEKPVCDAFEAKYHEDMRKLPVGDPRVQQIRAEFVTQLLREIRAMLDEVGKQQGRYIPNCYVVPVNNSGDDRPAIARESALAECMFNALDVETWIRDGLVDYLNVHVHLYSPHDGTPSQAKIREFTKLAKGTRTKVYVDMYPRRMPPRQYRLIGKNFYAAGADGLALWDAYNRHVRMSEWAFIKRLGHIDQPEVWNGRSDDYYHRVIPLRSLDGFVTDREFSLPTDG